MPETCSFCKLTEQTERVEFKGTVVSVCSDCSELVLDSLPPGKVTVQPLAEKDLELVLAWRNNPRIYDQFRKQNEPLEWNEHKEWFDSRPDDRFDYVIRFEDRRVGVVSLASDGDVSIYIGEITLWGEGIASQILKWLCRKFGDRKPLRAQIREDNQRSQSLFESCGFDQIDAENSWKIFEFSK
jgi:RimJ/RimL family protein N-acetyltransferase